MLALVHSRQTQSLLHVLVEGDSAVSRFFSVFVGATKRGTIIRHYDRRKFLIRYKTQ